VNRDLTLAVIVVVLGASGLSLMLPHKHGAAKPRTAHLVGAGLGVLALLLFSLFWSAPRPWISGLFFYGFSFAAVACGALMVTSSDPIRSALWFAAVVLSTAGLFLLAGASFLAAGTVIVYAGAIIVTFLFVIMLAQMEGRAVYDRAARMPLRATWTCFLLLLGVLWSVFQVPAASPPAEGVERLPRSTDLGATAGGAARLEIAGVVGRAVRPSARLVGIDVKGNPAPKPHVASLGETLYTDHLVTVELAGALLFVALIGAVAIAGPKPPVPPDGRRPGGATPANV
jgi:NADH-quinone oxidoreductase subunit J